MVRTQIQLTDEQARKLRRRSKQRGLSMSAMIRQYVDRGLGDQSSDLGATYQRAALLVGRFPDREAARDLATGHDRYLDSAFR
jgi:hypothetical protein